MPVWKTPQLERGQIQRAWRTALTPAAGVQCDRSRQHSREPTGMRKGARWELPPLQKRERVA